MPKGGARPGAGRPKGRKDDVSITKEMGREMLRRLVLEQLRPMTEAQMAAAKGLKYLVTREAKTGKFTKVTATMAGALKGDEVIEVWEKEPSTPAFTDLLNRALDKPADHVEMTMTKAAAATDDELKAKLALLLSKL